MKTRKHDKTSVVQANSTSLERWLNYHYYPCEDLLDLSWYEFHWYDTSWCGPTIYFEDPSFRRYLPQFMNNLNTYLKPDIKGLSLFGQSGFWSPKDNMKNLAENTTLEHLNLGANDLYPDDIKTLATNNHITELNLAYNFVGDGAAAFAENRVIEALYVPHCDIRKAGAQAIGNMAQLKSLDLSFNPAVKDEDAAAIINQLKNLRTINLEGTQVGKETVKALLANTNLTKIHLGMCQVDCITHLKIANVARRNYDAQTKLSKSVSTLFAKQPKEIQPDRNLKAVPISMTLRAS